MFRTLVVISGILICFSCQNPTPWTKTSFIQGSPELIQVKQEESQIYKGDGTGFVAHLTDTDGNKVGILTGWLITVDVKDNNLEGGQDLEERIGTMVFDLGNDNEIVVIGGNTIHHRQEQPKEGFSQKRAIVGGTGIYKGITGETISTRNQDGTYLHEMEYVLPH